MSLLASRLVGAALMLAGIAVGLWLALGVPQEWTGGMRWLRSALALTSFGAISLGPASSFPTARSRTALRTPRRHGIPSDSPDGVDGSRV